MANKKTKPSSGSAEANTVSKRLIDNYIDQYAESHQNKTNQLIHWFCIPIAVFSLFGLAWALPFPHITFLGQYNSFINWASFLMAFIVFYYYRLSPVLSYFMLMVMMLFSFGIAGLDGWAKAGGPALRLLSLVLLLVACGGQVAGNKMESKKASFTKNIRFFLIGPAWLMHFVLIKLKIRY